MEDELQKARQLGIRYLGRADRTVDQIRQRLVRASFSEVVIEQVLADFAQRRWLDDEQFARRWISSRLEKKPAGARRLASDLHQRGLAPETVARVLEEFSGTLDSPAAMVELLRRQRGRYAGLDEQKAKRRMLNFLRRRGYTEEGAWRALNQVWKEMQRDEIQGD